MGEEVSKVSTNPRNFYIAAEILNIVCVTEFILITEFTSFGLNSIFI